MTTALALASPSHRISVVCTYCGSPVDTTTLHYCPAIQADPVNGDRAALFRLPTAAIATGAE